MKARAWGNGSNDVLETAEIHFQGHLSCWNVFMSLTLVEDEDWNGPWGTGT